MRTLSCEEIEIVLDSSKLLQSCTSSYDNEELLLANPEFLQQLLLTNCCSESAARLNRLLSRSKQFSFDDQTIAKAFYSSQTPRVQQCNPSPTMTLTSVLDWLPGTMSKELRTKTDTLCLKLQNIWNKAAASEPPEQWDAKFVVEKVEEKDKKILTEWRSRVHQTPVVFVPTSQSSRGTLSLLSKLEHPKSYSLVCEESMYAMSTALQEEFLSFAESTVIATVSFYLYDSGEEPGVRQCVITNKESSKDESPFRGFSVQSTDGEGVYDLYLHGSTTSDKPIERLNAYTYYTLQISYDAKDRPRSSSHSWYTLQTGYTKTAYRKPFHSEVSRGVVTKPTLYIGAEYGASNVPENFFCGEIIELQIIKGEIPKILCDFIVEHCLRF